jgi:hypothetical protein
MCYLTDKPCWLYQAVLACCTNPVHTTGTTPASRQLPLSTASCTTWHTPHTCSSRLVVHIYQLVLGCVDMVHKPFACSVTTTTRQLAGSSQLNCLSSRLVVVCLRFLWCQVGQAAPGCTWLCTSCTNPVHGSNQNSWQTAATAQFELHNTPVIICVPRLVYTCGPAEPHLHLTVDM